MNQCYHCLEEGDWTDEDKCPKCESEGHTSPWRVSACPACNKSYYDGIAAIMAKINERTMNMHPAISHVLKFFVYEHLPEKLRVVSMPFAVLAKEVAERAPDNQETTIALRKLLESKDAAVRAAL